MDHDKYTLPTTVRHHGRRSAGGGAGSALLGVFGCTALVFLYLFVLPALRLVEREVSGKGLETPSVVAAKPLKPVQPRLVLDSGPGRQQAGEPREAGGGRERGVQADEPADTIIAAAAAAAATAVPTAPAAAAVDLSSASLVRGWRAPGGGSAAWVRGMSPEGAAALFASGGEGESIETFSCLQSGTAKQLPLSALNDEYCDCDDGMDEPGTAACASMPGARASFWCGGVPAAARALLPAAQIPTARVGDGVCDCCNGSDEWARMPRWHAAGTAAAEAAADGCPNTCNELARGAVARAAQLALGVAARDAMEIRGAELRANGGADLPADAGARDAFLPLSERCYKLFDEGYSYTLCPFKSASQDDRGTAVSLGAGFRWDDVKRDPGLAGEALLPGSLEGTERTMLLENGHPCPSGVRRSVRVHFSCAQETKLTHITEPQSCSYSFFLSTPAAC